MIELGTLLLRCRAGDDLAWEALVRRFQGRVHAVTLHYMRDPEEARDLAQETFVRVYERLGTIDGADTFLPWLLSLARNGCIDRLRRLKVRRPTAAASIDDVPEPTSHTPDAEVLASQGARRRLLYAAIDRLDALSREMILLKEIQELKLEEIAAMLGMPVGTVKSRSHRARAELAHEIATLDPSYGA